MPERNRWVKGQWDCALEEWKKEFERRGQALREVAGELAFASMRFTPFASAHEGAAIIREEFEELWDAVKRDDLVEARKEARQVAAMAMRFLMEIDERAPGEKEKLRQGTDAVAQPQPTFPTRNPRSGDER